MDNASLPNYNTGIFNDLLLNESRNKPTTKSAQWIPIKIATAYWKTRPPLIKNV